HFTCSQCGNCCTGGPGYVWVSDEEITRLADHLKLSREQTIDDYCRPVEDKFSLKEVVRQGNYDCIFLREMPVERRDGDSVVVHTKRACSIYPVRPLQCRTWPFWDGVLGGREIWELAGKRCHGIDRGKLWDRESIDKLKNAKDWPAEAPSSSKESGSSGV